MSSDTRPVALVTGASAGIGAAFARALAARGWDLILVARRRERLDALAREFGESRCRTLAADLATDAGMDAVAACLAAEERLELRVNNAGFGAHGVFWSADLAPQMQMHRLHVLATVRLTHAALAGLVARRRGAVLNVASVAGFAASPGSISYGATKRWMITFTEGLHMELAAVASPVKVQALCPGFTLSEFHDVAGIDRRRIADSFWMKAGDVVEASLRGLDRGVWLVVPGWRYQLLVRALALVPGGVRRWVSCRVTRRRGLKL